MIGSHAKRARLRLRSAINLSNAVVLARLNGSKVVSGYPKTGTTYLSTLAQAATGLTYLDGSMRLALRRSVIHCHFLNVPKSAVFSYRQFDNAIPSYVTHLLAYNRQDLLDRLSKAAETSADLDAIHDLAQSILRGHGRHPSPGDYYTQVAKRGGRIVDVPALAGPDSRERTRLAGYWGLSTDAIGAAIAKADAHAERMRDKGHEFYNRPSDRVREIIANNTDLSRRVSDEAAKVADIVQRARDE